MEGIKIIAIVITIIFLLSAPAAASQNLDEKNIMDGGSWDIGDRYYIMVEGVDYEGDQAFVSIWQEGEMMKEDLVQAGEKFEYRSSSNTLIVSMKLTTVFRGFSGSTCRFTDIYLRYGEEKATSIQTPTQAGTPEPTDTPVPRSTEDIAFGEGALIPGPSVVTLAALLLLAAVMHKKRKGT